MKILDHAAKLEKALLDRLGRRTGMPRHPIELYRAILDEIEEATEPGTRGARIFPYTVVTVTLATRDPRQRATAEAVFAEPPSLTDRVRARLQHAGCRNVEAVTAVLKLVDASAAGWGGGDYALEFRRETASRAAARSPKGRPARGHALHLTVVAGTAAKSRYAFSATRINIGRLADVLDRQQQIVRQNHVAFVDGDDDIGQSVSRTHAHIRFDPDSAEARLHDDGSTHGTRLVRAGRTMSVPASGGRGVALRDGDEVILGQARVRVEMRPTRRR